MARLASARTGGTGDREMMRLVAELYYGRDLRQPEIASLTGFSVSKVSRLLAQARELGVVRIAIEAAPEERPALAHEMSERFGTLVELTPGRESDSSVAARLCGLGAGDVVLRHLPASGAIGIAGGFTIDALASSLPRVDRPGLTIVPVVGGWDARNRHLDVNEVARRIADRLGAQVRFLHAPGVVDTPEMKKALLSDSSIAAATKHWRHLEGALLGVGGGPTSHPGYGTVMDRLDDGSRRGLASMEIVGDIGGHFFRLDGEFSEEGWSDRTVAIPVPDLRRTPRVIAIAAGPNKVSAILGALRTRVAHVLITDTPTAEAVLRLADRLPVAAA